MYNNIALLVGHLCGDYLFQNDWMATNKNKPGILGCLVCLSHTIIYSFIVAAFVVFLTGWKSILVSQQPFIAAFAIVFVSHYWIDRYSLGGKWMKWIKGGVFAETISLYSDGKIKSFTPREFFLAPVYIAVDNTMHLVLMWIAFSFC